MPTQALRLRIKSILTNGKIYPISAEFPIARSYYAAPGTGGDFIFNAPRPCKVVKVDYVADVNGAGSSKVFLRKHSAATAAAANSAVTTGVVDLITGGIAADSAVRIATHPALVTTTGVTLLATGDKLSLVAPATWIGAVVVWIVWI